MSDSKNLSFTEFRARVGDLRGKEFWRSLEDLSRSDVFDDFMHQEFPQQAAPLSKGVDRRDFMKLMGASVAMAGLAACRQPAEAIVPYVNQPESLIPGKPLYFATAMPHAGVATGVLLAAWGVFIRLNKSAEEIEPEAMERAKEEDRKVED
jgi:molybdopterin-containing oxidoreductase family iron-sulfur binding subunit